MTELIERVQDVLGDRYDVQHEVGRGGMATVFLALDRKHEREVALKVLHPELATAVGSERFLREIRITAKLQHPHILTLLDSGQVGDILYYVMPFIAGDSLRDHMARHGQMSLEDTVLIAREVADAIEYAHGQGVVHRDIKPDNILLSNGHAIVADFGIARAVTGASGSSLTAAGFPIGTASYMSPEQARGEEEVDSRADIYSLGAVVYEMLAGRPPFTGANITAVLTKMLTTAPPPLADARPDVPPDLIRGVDQALAKEPADRFQTVTEFAQALAYFPCGTSLSWVTPANGQHRSIPPAALPPTYAAARGRSGWWLLSAAALALFALGVTVWRPWGQTASAVPGQAVSAASVAVMPLDVIGNRTDDAYLGEGLMQEIITSLAQVEQLKVISRTTVVALKNRGLTVSQIADTLGVEHVLEGSVERIGDRVRVDLQLIEASSDRYVWTQRFDTAFTELNAVRSEIARSVSDALIAQVGLPMSLSQGSRTASAPAYEAYLRGTNARSRRTPESLRAAITHFDRAIALDSTYAPAYSGVAVTRGLWVFYGYGDGVDAYGELRRALSLAEHAIGLDPRLAEGYAARAMVSVMAWAPGQQSLRDFERALRLQPNAAEFHAWYAVALAREGRYGDALTHARLGVVRDPMSPGLIGGSLAFTALGARQYDVAIRRARQARQLEPSYVFAGAVEAVSLLLMGRAEECASVDVGPLVEVRAMCLSALQSPAAQPLIDSVSAELGRRTPSMLFRPGLVAAYYARLGDVPRTITWLERSFEASPVGLDFRYIDSGLFDPVRRDRDFAEALVRLRNGVQARVFWGDAHQ